MITPVVDNPAVTDPRKALTKIQRDALLSISFYRYQRLTGASWLIGQKRFSTSTINSIQRLQLIAPPLAPGAPIRITTAGKLAIDKLKENT
jgi:hypothetical protein